MYSKEQHEEIKYDFELAKGDVYKWKAHIMRAENQEEGKQEVLRNLNQHAALLLIDWAMKFNQLRYREKQSEWFAKRGMNWHVSSVVTKDEHGNLQVFYFAHLFDSCTQDWYAVTSILESLIKAIKDQVDPLLKKVFLRSDEAACYHNVNLYAAAKDVGQRMGVTVEGYDHSEPQFGKDITDRIICPMKGCLRRYCNEGNNILSSEDMHKALKSRPVKGTTAAVCVINEKSQDLKVKKIKGFSAFHNVRYEDNGLRVWKAFGVGKGRLIQWDSIYLHHQGPTNIEISEQDFFPISSRNIKLQSRPNETEAPNGEEDKLFKCQEQNCSAAFHSIEEVEAHHTLFDHKRLKVKTESLYDTLKRKWVGKFSDVTSQPKEKSSVEHMSSKAKNPALHKGWALHKPRCKAKRFSKKVKVYLTAKYDIGERTKHKCDPLQVSKDMRRALSESGDRLFSQSEWLSKTQIQGFFSRLTAKRRKKHLKSPNQKLPDAELSEDSDNDDESEEEFDDDEEDEDPIEDDMYHDEIVQSVLDEVALTHPIMYDVYDLCSYVRQDKLHKFTVPMLKDMCIYLDVSFKSKDRKDALINTITEVVHECSCFM
jgi:hypothetical protein